MDVCGVSFRSRQASLVLETLAAPGESVGPL